MAATSSDPPNSTYKKKAQHLNLFLFFFKTGKKCIHILILALYFLGYEKQFYTTLLFLQ